MRTTTLMAAGFLVAALSSPAIARHGSYSSSSSSSSTSSSSQLPADLPLNARPGECFAQVYEPPRFETVTEQILLKPASERVDVIPARYETVTETVLVKPASTRLVDVPARWDWVDETVLSSPARSEWKSSSCSSIGAVQNGTGECVCLVDIPAKYETVRKHVMIAPASTRLIESPAEFETVQKSVMRSPAQERRTAIPAEYTTVTRQVQVSNGRRAWVKVGCESADIFALDRMNTLRLERNLREAGYDPGLADGVFSENTRRALSAYQADHGLPVGSCDSLTLESLIP